MKLPLNGLITTLSLLAFSVAAVPTKKAEPDLQEPAPLVSAEDCDTSFVSLTSIASVLDPSETNLLGSSYNATSCIGVFYGENDDAHGLSSPDPNIGQFGDGLLNGENGLLNGLEFISESDLQDLDGDGVATDPGWIHLGHLDADNSELTYSNAGPSPSAPGLTLDIGDLLTLSFECFSPSSTAQECVGYYWELRTKLDIIGSVQELLGEATFDHLAFSIKASNGFAVYDFNFKEIFAQELEDNPGSTLNFNTPYVLAGQLTTGDFLNKHGNPQAVSHLNVWARDPSDTPEIPEPHIMLSFALGLLGIAVLRRRRKN